MAVQIFVLPVLVIIAIIVAAVVYMKTKSIVKVGGVFQIIFAIAVLGLATQLVDAAIISIAVLLGLGILINGIINMK
jgi:hypothetical protein